MRTNSVFRLVMASLFVCLLAALPHPANANTPAEQRYVTTIAREVSQIGKTLVNFSALIKNPKKGQRQWTDDIAVCCVQMRMFPSEARKTYVPIRFRGANRHLMAALKGYSYIGYHFPEDLDTNNTQDGRLCAVKMGKADDEINRFGVALKAAGAS